ncbi:MAG TPA: iron ABC transporter permease [Mycobacteriales bacterium]|nr:iron ABC transporter permease [Mycobacteriales bacterium]
MHSGGSPATTGAPPSPVGAASLSRRRRAAALAGAAVLLALSATVSLAAGSRALPTVDVLRVLVSPDGSDTSVIVRELRLPRTVLGLVVGAALGVAGAQLQGLTRNALADPGLLGVAAGAALAVVATSTVLGVGGLGGQAAAAVLGALGAALAVWLLGGRGRGGTLSLVLAGVAVTALCAAVVRVLVLLDADRLDEYRFWVVGSLAGRDLGVLPSVTPLLVVGVVLAVATARTLDLLSLGDDVAAGLGVDVAWGRAGTALSATLLTAAAVAVAGPLVFVGLVVPHLARALVGPAHRWLLPLSALLGASLLIACDVVGRVVARPAEVQVGIVTALVGAPVLVAVVRRRRVAAA